MVGLAFVILQFYHGPYKRRGIDLPGLREQSDELALSASAVLRQFPTARTGISVSVNIDDSSSSTESALHIIG
jgi:hypothetical protein